MPFRCVSREILLVRALLRNAANKQYLQHNLTNVEIINSVQFHLESQHLQVHSLG